MMTENTQDIIKTAKEASKAASEIIMSLMNKAKIDIKGINNLVTEADLKSEEAIRAIILRDFPTHSIFGEEGGGEKNFNVDHLWIIDPLDGTNNYAHGFPFFCVSIAYAEKGEVKAGIVFDPIRNEMFQTMKGCGAFLNGTQIFVSDRSLDSALVSAGFYYDRGEIMRTTLKSIQRLFENNIRGIRRTGSAALDCCYVAAGRTDAYFEYLLYPWDFAAGMLIINEAGGDSRDASGAKLSIESNTIAVSNGSFTNEFISLIKYPAGH